MHSDNPEQPVCIMVDAYSSGASLARTFSRNGCRMVHVRSSPEISHHFLDTYPKGIFGSEYNGWGKDIASELGKESPDLIIPGTESGVCLADTLAEQLGTPGNGTALSPARRDKQRMKEALTEAGIRVTPFFSTRNFNQLLSWVRETGYPVVLKPPASAGSDSVTVCRNRSTLETAFRAILNVENRLGILNTSVLAEKYIEGEEYIIDTVSRDGEHLVIDICSSTKRTDLGSEAIYDTISLLDPNMESLSGMREYFFRVLDALGIRFGPAHGEIRMTEKGPVLVEVAARMCGAGLPDLFSRCLPRHPAEIVSRAYLEKDRFRTLKKTENSPEKFLSVVYMAVPKTSSVNTGPDPSCFDRLPSFSLLEWHPTPGSIIPATTDLFTCPGYVLLEHESRAQIDNDTRIIREELEHKMYRKILSVV